MRKFRIPIELTNRNDGQGHHWSRTAKDKKRIAAILSTLPSPFFGVSFPCSLIVTRILGPGQRLWDNDSILRGNWKQVQDAMVGAGWLEDDDPRYLAETVGRQDKTRRDEGPAIEVCIVDGSGLQDWLEDVTSRAETEEI